MPRGDGTGPMGAGSMTGRAAGYCAGYGVPGYANPVGGRGRGMGGGMGMAWRRGRGGGFSFRNRAYAAYPAYPTYPAPALSPDHEKTYLENEMAALKEEQEAVKKRLDELKTKK